MIRTANGSRVMITFESLAWNIHAPKLSVPKAHCAALIWCSNNCYAAPHPDQNVYPLSKTFPSHRDLLHVAMVIAKARRPTALFCRNAVNVRGLCDNHRRGIGHFLKRRTSSSASEN
jgi:hypothetical protein